MIRRAELDEVTAGMETVIEHLKEVLAPQMLDAVEREIVEAEIDTRIGLLNPDSQGDSEVQKMVVAKVLRERMRGRRRGRYAEMLTRGIEIRPSDLADLGLGVLTKGDAAIIGMYHLTKALWYLEQITHIEDSERPARRF